MAFISRALTVLVIAHNDAATLAATVDRIYRALTITVEEFCIHVFDDGSTDDTPRIAEGLSHQYPFLIVQRNERRHGPGYCTIAASAKADTPFLVYIPADNTWPLRSFIELFGHIGKADIITSYPTNLLISMSPAKRFVTRSYTFILNMLFGRRMRYYNGLTVYPLDYLRQQPIGTYGFGFQAEALIKAITAGHSFLEVALPVDAANVPQSRSVTPANTVNAGATILRLFFELHVLRRARSFRPTPRSMTGGGPGVDELGITEFGTNGAKAPANGQSRGQLRIVVVGASSGIGARLADALAQDGHRLFICARRADRLAQVASGRPNMRTYVCDVSDEAKVRAFVAALGADTDGVDVLVNCAGIFGEIGPVETSDSAFWWRTMEVNLFGTYLVTKHALPLLKNGRCPRIINFAGGGAFSSFANYSAYACSKAAIVRLTECTADELYPVGIRVNCVAPGFIATEMHKATLAAGESRAGRLQFRRTQSILEQGGAPMENVVECVRALISPTMDELSGKTISSSFDPWQTGAFRASVDEISRSDLYTLRRVNIVNLPEGRLRSTLSHPWADGTRTKS
jgi:NAD(P)-dependent dehydrogenase (short-subunit alcohol dehydrogenase family)